MSRRAVAVVALVMAATTGLGMTSALAAPPAKDEPAGGAAAKIHISADGAPNVFGDRPAFESWVQDVVDRQGRMGNALDVDDFIVYSTGDYGRRATFVTWISAPGSRQVDITQGFSVSIAGNELRPAGYHLSYARYWSQGTTPMIFGVRGGEIVTQYDGPVDAIGVVLPGWGEAPDPGNPDYDTVDEVRGYLQGLAPLKFEVCASYADGPATCRPVVMHP